jgi:hypothetical protein
MRVSMLLICACSSFFVKTVIPTESASADQSPSESPLPSVPHQQSRSLSQEPASHHRIEPVSAPQGLRPQSRARACGLRPRAQFSMFAICSPSVCDVCASEADMKKIDNLNTKVTEVILPTNRRCNYAIDNLIHRGMVTGSRKAWGFPVTTCLIASPPATIEYDPKPRHERQSPLVRTL